jgi:SAM-dependent methyltransferase
MTSFITYLPSCAKSIPRRIYYFSDYYLHRIFRHNSMIPPRTLNFIGSIDFEKVGIEFREYFTGLGGLQPDHRVLDVGCGIGRMAIPLTGYLSGKGEYYGFDVVKKGIDWCRNHISTKFTHFVFMHSDIYNKTYNPGGRITADKYRFPFEDNYFDFVNVTSVFTHMLPNDVENYMHEISRVLKCNGKCLITSFLLNTESADLLTQGKSTLDFRFDLGDCLTTNISEPEQAIAYKEDYFFAIVATAGLDILEPVYYGSWCDRDSSLSYQDLIIALKPR